MYKYLPIGKSKYFFIWENYWIQEETRWFFFRNLISILEPVSKTRNPKPSLSWLKFWLNFRIWFLIISNLRIWTGSFSDEAFPEPWNIQDGRVEFQFNSISIIQAENDQISTENDHISIQLHVKTVHLNSISTENYKISIQFRLETVNF